MRMYSNLLLGNFLVQRQQLVSMLKDSGNGEVEIFVSPTTVCGSFVGAIGGDGAEARASAVNDGICLI